MNKIIEILTMILTLLVMLSIDKEEKKSDVDQEGDTRKTIRIYCEKINNIYYAWLKDTQNFIGQSESSDELANMLLRNYPTKTYNVIIEEKIT